MRTFFFTCVLLLSISHVTYSQILLLRGVDSLIQTMYEENCTVFRVTDSDILVVGLCKLGIDESITATKILEKKVDSGWYYFALYPKKNGFRLTDIARYGIILYEARNYIIFKARLEVLSAYRGFENFEIVQITKDG